MPANRLRNVWRAAFLVGFLFAFAALFLLFGADTARPEGAEGRQQVLLAMAAVAGLALVIGCLGTLASMVQQQRRRRQRRREDLHEAERRADIAIRRARIRAEIKDSL